MVGDPLLNGARPAATAAAAAAVDVEALYREHRIRLTRLATAITLDRNLAEELVHDAFAGLQRRRDTVENPTGYLQRSVINLAVKVLRRRSVARRHPLPPPLITNSPEIDETWTAVARLPVRQRAVVVLRYWEDLAEVDIAGVLGWPAGTVKSTLHRAMQQLRKELTP